MEWVKVPYESIRKPGDPEFIPSRAGGLGSGIGAHAGRCMAYNARILFRVTVCFSAAGRLPLGHSFLLFSKAEHASGTGSPANPKLSGWQPDARLDCDREGELTVCFTPLMHWRQF